MLQTSCVGQSAKTHAAMGTVAGLLGREQRTGQMEDPGTSRGQSSARGLPATPPADPSALAGDVMVCGIETQWPMLRLSLDAHGLSVTSCSGWSQAVRKALLHAAPKCILVGSGFRGLNLCREIRAVAALAHLNVIALVSDPWSTEAKAAMAAGVDDFLPSHQLEQLNAKLHALAERGPLAARPRAGKALVVDPDRGRRIQLGRAIQRLGLNVVFALDAAGLVDDGSVQLVVINEGLLAEARAKGLGPKNHEVGQSVPWIVCGTSSELHQARERIGRDLPVGFYDFDTDPSQLVFIANNLSCGQGLQPRRSKRLPHEGPVRLERQSRESWGYLYNINRGGVYVRTLTPPPHGARLSLEFQPPFGRGRVVVEGDVVWQQGFSGRSGYHPGCGIEFRDLPVSDAAALAAGYGKLLEQCGELFR